MKHMSKVQPGGTLASEKVHTGTPEILILKLVLMHFRAQGWSYYVQCEGPITPGYSLSVNDKDPCLYKHHLAILI